MLEKGEAVFGGLCEPVDWFRKSQMATILKQELVSGGLHGNTHANPGKARSSPCGQKTHAASRW
jgi:hypothetical protein